MVKYPIYPTAVCVFCASSSSVDPAIFAAGRTFGEELAKAGLAMVYGGTTCGLMGAVSEAYKKKGGPLIGVIPKFMIEAGLKNPHLDETVEVTDMSSRKAKMNQRSGAFVILPGGFGTFDEFFDVLAQKQVKLHAKPIILLNTLDYFKPLMEMLHSGIRFKTIDPKYLDLFKVVATPEEVLPALT